MRAHILVSWLVAASASATIQSISDLQPEKLVGTWEAIPIHDGIAMEGVYQMSFSGPDRGFFVATSSKFSESPPLFLGKLSSAALKDGHVTLEFSPIGASADYEYRRVHIDARGSTSADLALIEGKITIYRRDGKVSTEPVFFANKLWVKDLAGISAAAQRILRHAGTHE